MLLADVAIHELLQITRSPAAVDDLVAHTGEKVPEHLTDDRQRTRAHRPRETLGHLCEVEPAQLATGDPAYGQLDLELDGGEVLISVPTRRPDEEVLRRSARTCPRRPSGTARSLSAAFSLLRGSTLLAVGAHSRLRFHRVGDTL